MNYDHKIMRVCDYIQQNLDEEMTLEQLSRVAALSKFHFHRLFSTGTGMSLFRFIQHSRLKRASYHLAFKKERRVIEIALDAGFDSPEAFSRAFKRLVGQTPSAFRKNPAWPEWHTTFKTSPTLPTGEIIMDVKIVDFPETRIAKIVHKGPPDRVLETASAFIEWRKSTGLSPVQTSKTFGVPFNDPNVVDPADFHFEICGAESRDIPENPQGVTAGLIPGGRCAVVRHQGSHDKMDPIIYALYREWLPTSDQEVRDFPVFFHYINLLPEVDECDLLTDIYLPLK